MPPFFFGGNALDDVAQVGGGVFWARRLADDGRKGGIKVHQIKAHQDEERTRPLSSGMEGSMAGCDTFTDPLFASQDSLLFSPVKGKTPLVLPRTLSGERRKGPCFANLRNQVLSLAGGRRSSSGERQRGSCHAGSLRFPHR